MTPIDQTILHDPANGVSGNCFAAFLASALEIPIEEIPNFAQDCPEDGVEFYRRIIAYLAPLNLAIVNIDVAAHFAAYGVKGVVHELYGDSPRGVCHATLGVDGAMVHDPHPSKDGLMTTAAEWGIFIVIDPSKPSGRFAVGAA